MFVYPMSKALNFVRRLICYRVWKVILVLRRLRYSRVFENLETLDIKRSETHSHPLRSRLIRFLILLTFSSAKT